MYIYRERGWSDSPELKLGQQFQLEQFLTMLGTLQETTSGTDNPQPIEEERTMRKVNNKLR